MHTAWPRLLTLALRNSGIFIKFRSHVQHVVSVSFTYSYFFRFSSEIATHQMHIRCVFSARNAFGLWCVIWCFFAVVRQQCHLSTLQVRFSAAQNSLPLANGLNLWMQRAVCNTLICCDKWTNVLMVAGIAKTANEQKRHFCGECRCRS